MKELFNYFTDITLQVAILFIMIAIGFIMTHFKMLGEAGVKQITDIILYAVTPAVIIKAFVGVEFTRDSVSDLVITLVSSVAVHIFTLIVGLFCFRRLSRDKRNLYTACALFSNCGYMSVPLTQALLGDRGVFMVSIYIGVFNVVLWTVGLKLFSDQKLSAKKILLNPGLISVAIGLILFFGRINLSSVEVIYGPIVHMSNLNAPLAMIVIGYYLRTAKLGLGKSDLPMLGAIGIRLIAVPSVLMLVMRFCGVSGVSLMANVIPASAPFAAGVMMFASKFNGDTAEASKAVSLSHIVSIVTMPVMLTLCRSLGG